MNLHNLTLLLKLYTCHQSNKMKRRNITQFTLTIIETINVYNRKIVTEDFRSYACMQFLEMRLNKYKIQKI